MSRASISVALCTYNGAQYLQQQLESIAAQTVLPDQLVICDDRSADNTHDIAQRFATRVKCPVKLYINDVNLGPTKNFEKAISLCSADIVALADQDDSWHSEKLQRLSDALTGSPDAGASFSDGEVVDESMRPVGCRLWECVDFDHREQKRVREGHALGVLLKHNVATGATLAFRSEYKRLIIPIPVSWFHDAWITLLIAAVGQLVPIDEPLIAYRQHSQNQLGVLKKERRKKPPRPFSDKYADPITRITDARDRLLAMQKDYGVRDSVISELDAMIEHLQVRAALPNSRWRRLPPAIRELLGLRYHRYSNQALRRFKGDLLRPVPKTQSTP